MLAAQYKRQKAIRSISTVHTNIKQLYARESSGVMCARFMSFVVCVYACASVCYACAMNAFLLCSDVYIMLNTCDMYIYDVYL